MIRKMGSGSKTNVANIRKQTANTDGFLEALRNLGGTVSDSLGKVGELKPNQSLNLNELKQGQEYREKQRWQFQQDFLDIRKQEKLIWTRAEQETKLQITALIQELKKIAESTKELAKEVQIAAVQAPVEPGSYHLSFFENLRETILLFRKHIQESASWLAAFNQKAKKRNFYWRQVRKSGTKFMLSSERYMATQAG